MVMIGGKPSDLGLGYPSTVAGVAPMDCGDKMPRDIAFVFADSIKALVPSSALAVQVAETSAHESAHTYGLPHSGDPCDLMSYGNCSKLKTFLDKMMSMQSDSYGKCGLTQMNSHQMLLDNLGPAGSTQPPPPPPPQDDTTPPAVGITSPAAGATVTSGVTVKASVTDNQGVVKAELLVDGKVVTSRTTAPWEFNAGTLSQGTHLLKVKAYDAAGNAGEASVTVSVPGTQPPPPPPNQDTTPPSVAITSPASGATVASNLTVKATITDDKGVTKADLLVDGSIVSSRTAAPWEFKVALNLGTHKLEVNAHDAAGNEGGAMVTVTVTDSAPPTTSPPDPGTTPTEPSPPPPPPPGSFGSTCESAKDCDSQLCARDESFAVTYCTETCDPGSDTCPDGAGCFPAGGEVFVCGPPPEQTPQAFTADGESLIGGCTVGGSEAGDPGDPVALVALLLLLVIGRRRR
jgi:MYXO-CTERM domain-containing protein